MKKTALTFYRRGLQTLSQLRGDPVLCQHVRAPEMAEVICRNRAAVGQVNTWVIPNLIENSIFRYGVNPDTENLLDLPLDDGCTHTDLLVYYGQRLAQPRKYLELGVSVGKTFWQVLNNCGPCECWGFDIEEMTPVLKSRLVEQSREEWAGPADSIKKTPSSITRYLHRETGNHVTYLCADIFDEQAWAWLAGQKFNLVLSDALHTASALEFEWTHLSQADILHPDEVVVMWDDLNGEMKTWFLEKQSAISRQLAVAPADVRTVFLNGWLGRREFPHRLGLALKSAALRP
jgi:hypothetical protein